MRDRLIVLAITFGITPVAVVLFLLLLH